MKKHKLSKQQYKQQQQFKQQIATEQQKHVPNPHKFKELETIRKENEYNILKKAYNIIPRKEKHKVDTTYCRLHPIRNI